MLLADAAAATTEGPLASFTMNERDRYELKIAGLLHDCGKVTTPVHVVDKGTKLQTIFDRIHLVDTRFEVLKRDAELYALRQQLSLRPCVNPQAEAALTVAAQAQVDALNGERGRRSHERGSFSACAQDWQRACLAQCRGGRNRIPHGR
jgi:hypothetical protein